MAHWSCCFQLFSVLSPKSHLMKIILRSELWRGHCHLGLWSVTKHDPSWLFSLSYPWSWSVADQRPWLNLELTVRLSPDGCPGEGPQEEAGDGGGQTTRPSATTAQDSAPIQDALKGLILKHPFFRGEQFTRNNDWLYTCSDGDPQPTG